MNNSFKTEWEWTDPPGNTISTFYRDKKNYVLGDKVVVMSFPGTGKTEAANKYPDIFVEVDASDYYWAGLPLLDDMGEFPKNYVDKIEEVLADSTIKASIVLVCNHLEVAQELRDRKIKFCVMFSTHGACIDGLKRARYCNHIIDYFRDNYAQYNSTLYELCNRIAIATGSTNNILDIFLGSMGPSAIYRIIIDQFNRSV